MATIMCEQGHFHFAFSNLEINGGNSVWLVYNSLSCESHDRLHEHAMHTTVNSQTVNKLVGTKTNIIDKQLHSLGF